MRVLLTSIAAAGLFAANPAAADSLDGAYSVSIPYQDLNLASAAGYATFQGRVKAQVNRVCSSDFITPVRETDDIRQCRAQLTRAAERSLELTHPPVSGKLVAYR